MSSNLCKEFSTLLQINWFTGLHQMVHLMDHKWGIFYNIPNLLIVLSVLEKACVGASTQRDHVVIKLFRNISWEETFEMKLDLKSTVIKTKGEVAKKKRREEGVAGGGWGEGAGLCKELSCVALHESGQLHSGGKFTREILMKRCYQWNPAGCIHLHPHSRTVPIFLPVKGHNGGIRGLDVGEGTIRAYW